MFLVPPRFQRSVSGGALSRRRAGLWLVTALLLPGLEFLLSGHPWVLLLCPGLMLVWLLSDPAFKALDLPPLGPSDGMW